MPPTMALLQRGNGWDFLSVNYLEARLIAEALASSRHP